MAGGPWFRQNRFGLYVIANRNGWFAMLVLGFSWIGWGIFCNAVMQWPGWATLLGGLAIWLMALIVAAKHTESQVS